MRGSFLSINSTFAEVKKIGKRKFAHRIRCESITNIKSFMNIISGYQDGCETDETQREEDYIQI